MALQSLVHDKDYHDDDSSDHNKQYNFDDSHDDDADFHGR